jgi:hypothetical protein
MEANNAHPCLVQPNFSPGDYVLGAEPRLFQHKLTFVWKEPYQVDKVFDNHTLRVNSCPDQCSLTNGYVDDNSCLISE